MKTKPAEQKCEIEEEEIRSDSIETNTVVNAVAESKESVDNSKSDKEQKKDKKEKRKKEKEEKTRRKKEKKEKREKKKTEVDTQNKLEDEKELGGTNNTTDSQGTEPADPEPEFDNYGESYQEYAEEGCENQGQGWYDENGQYHANTEEDYIYYYDEESNIVGYEGPQGYVEGNPFQVRILEFSVFLHAVVG